MRIKMRGQIALFMLLGACVAALSAGAGFAGTNQAEKREKSQETWPETKAGEMARRWVEAFSSGDEAMRKFLTKYVPAENLEERPVEERLESIRELRQRFATLRLAYLVRSTPFECEAMLAAPDGTKHKFTFAVTNTPPYKMRSVTFHDVQRHGH